MKSFWVYILPWCHCHFNKTLKSLLVFFFGCPIMDAPLWRCTITQHPCTPWALSPDQRLSTPVTQIAELHSGQVRPQYCAPNNPEQTQRGITCVRCVAHSAACDQNRGWARLSLFCLRRFGRPGFVHVLDARRVCWRCRVCDAAATVMSWNAKGAEKHVRNPPVSSWPSWQLAHVAD